ncbi:methyltransferase domain-containing protein [Nocardioides sp. TRM66260-LWL]|uniref:methyltransferase domain-containing protein n=1 Tax=Nocardioides sp. TRM66260-LWL TaxID=2874478 RepID=UPI001CC72385|nr:methyltransferase domain-containing protein [Nocardioides sp. TRM66260-LWL]MBZ5733334.1 methyltransferase domain-containing protein [Nocardioides sp. TRM66260-LWL]
MPETPAGSGLVGDRPSERRHAARLGAVWSALEPLVAPASAGGALDVLDIGGGTGGLAVRIAEAGHRVTVVDPSPDALAALDRRARESGVTVAGEQGDLSSLPERGASVDLLLCHGVLELADDPAAALAGLASVLRPGGTLSLLVAQRHAAVIARAMAGHFQQARALLDEDAAAPGSRGRRFVAEELLAWLQDAGLTPGLVQAIRVFADLVPGSLLDLEPGATAALLELERAVAERPEFRPLAARLHVLAVRPA